MKYFVGIFLILLIFFLYQNTRKAKTFEIRLEKNRVYQQIKYDIKKGMIKDEVYTVLKNKDIQFHNDKNGNIDISGQGLTIELNNSDIVYRIIPY